MGDEQGGVARAGRVISTAIDGRAELGPDSITRVLNVMGCRSVQYGSFEDYLVAVTRACCQRGMVPVFAYPGEPAVPRFREDIEAAGGEYVVVPGTDSFTVEGMRGLWRTIERLHPCIVHGHFGRPGYLGAALGHLGRTPVVLLSKHQTSWPRLSPATRIVYTMLVRWTWAVLVGATPVLEELASIGLPAKKCRLIPFPGIDVDRYRMRPELRAAARSGLGVSENQTLVAAVSHLQERKGLQFLIPALGPLLEAHPDAILAIVGDGPERPRLEALASECGVSSGARFLGHRSDIPELLAAADVFVCPSLCEGGCAGTLEAMAAGLPVVTTPVGIARDLILRSDSGAVVEPGSPTALAKGLSDMIARRAEWTAMGRRARDAVTSAAEFRHVAETLADTYVQAAREAAARA